MRRIYRKATYPVLLALALFPPHAQAAHVAHSPLVSSAAIGNVQAVTVSATAPIVYVATDRGLYRSANATFSLWSRQNSLTNITALTLDPRHPRVLLYSRAISSSGTGTYRSVDGGRSARQVSPHALGAFARASSRPSTVYALDDLSVVRSDDDGQTWTTVYSTKPFPEYGDQGLSLLTADPHDARHLLAADTWGHNDGVALQSFDGGHTWHMLEASPGEYVSVLSLLIDPVRPSSMWVVWWTADGIHHSSDGGLTWAPVTGGFPAGPAPSLIGAVADPLTGRVYVTVVPQGNDQAYGDLASPQRIFAFDQYGDGTEFAPEDWLRAGVMTLTANGYLLSWQQGGFFVVQSLTAPGAWAVAAPFRRYVASIDQTRLLGQPISPMERCRGVPCQYFEKGRLEAQGRTRHIAVGTLVSDLLAARAPIPIGGHASSVTYRALARATRRIAPPPGFRHGVWAVPGGTFVPASTGLTGPGYVVPSYFWRYMTTRSGAPHGWRQDIGVPLTQAIHAIVTKGAGHRRSITLQAFQNVILTYDPRNAATWQVERANIGDAYATTFPSAVR